MTELHQRAEKVLGYTFQNLDLLKESLTHASIADNRLNSNERMEFLGDAVLDLVICEALYKKFPNLLEGDLTKIKSAVVSRRTCAEVSIETGLVDLLIIGKGISVARADAQLAGGGGVRVDRRGDLSRRRVRGREGIHPADDVAARSTTSRRTCTSRITRRCFSSTPSR